MSNKQRSEAAIAELVNAPRPGIKLSLAHLEPFFEAIGNPHHSLPPTVHVAGTNGKGSTIAYLRAIYETQGLRVHSYTSPHLITFHERINLAGTNISDEHLLRLIDTIKPAQALHPVTFFEATTAIAFMAFHDVPADVLLLEVGLGGRLDTTNIIPQKHASVITPIGMDHTEFLGDSLEKIAIEKARIMQKNVPVLSAQQAPEAEDALRAHAQKVGALWHDWTADKVVATQAALMGGHQQQNAALAAAVATALSAAIPVSGHSIKKGVANAHWPARMQQLKNGPLVDAWGARGSVVLDGAHNAAAAERLAQHIQKPATIICGIMNRKDVVAYLQPLKSVAAAFIAIDIPGMENDCMPAEALAEHARTIGIEVVRTSTLEGAAEQLDDCATDTLIICGSLYLAGEVLKNHG